LFFGLLRLPSDPADPRCGVDDAPDEPIPLPITGELDLHTFHPRDLPELLPAYLEACRERGLLTVRIIHGKGTGTLRTTVHAWLRRSPWVAGFRLGDETSGSWGATVVQLHPREPRPPAVP
jgi:DNA-nicking Smr family endonuclease